jgi:hypothetical protein
MTHKSNILITYGWLLSEGGMVVSCQMNNISARLWREQVTFYEMKMLLALYKIEMLSWIFIVLSHRNNHPRIHIATIDTVSWFRTILCLLCTSECCIPSGEASNTIFIAFGLITPTLKILIYCTWHKHANNYTTNVFKGGLIVSL